MPIDLSNIGVGGGFVAACALYAGASLLGGQVIAERMIARSDWQLRCEAGIVEAIPLPARPTNRIPARTCGDVMSIFGAEATQLCGPFIGYDFNSQARRAEDEVYSQQRRLAEARRDQAAQSAGSQCGCAVDVHLSDRAVAYAVLAGTARLISLPTIDDPEQGLQQALSSSTCQAVGGAS